SQPPRRPAAVRPPTGEIMDNQFLGRLRVLFAVLLTLAALCWATTRPEAAEPRRDKVSTVIYDVSDLVYRQGPPRPGYSIEEIIKAVTAASPEAWQGSVENAGTIEAVNNTRLEVHATAAVHAEVVKTLDRLRQHVEVAVDVDSEVYEIDQKDYDKHLR